MYGTCQYKIEKVNVGFMCDTFATRITRPKGNNDDEGWTILNNTIKYASFFARFRLFRLN